MLIPVILSGGNGSRLWPFSHEAHPKPFLRLNGETHSLLQKTYQRALHIPYVQQILTVTNCKYYYQTKRELNDITQSAQKRIFNFLLEPLSRNTAPAIVLSTLFIQKVVHSKAVVLVLPADHLISNQVKFNLCIKKAYQAAQQGSLITFGIIPHKPETAYGYIEYSPSSEKSAPYAAIHFHEKPSFKKAKFFIEQGNYLWNSGIFCFTVATLLKNFREHAPQFYQKILTYWKNIEKNYSFSPNMEHILRLEKKNFSELKNISIDYAIMEKSKNINVIPADFGWSDIGSWDALSSLLKADKNKNRVIGNAILKNSYNTTVYSQSESKRLITALGVKNLTIVDTNDALLVCEHAYVQKVKQLVEELKAGGYPQDLPCRTVYRPWGYYTILAEGSTYKLKQIIVYTQARLSLQMHQYRSEYWVVLEGIATVQNNEKQFTLKSHESTFIAAGTQHRLSNLELTTLTLIELQIGDYLGEDDIIRIQDDYERIDTLCEEHSIS